MTRDKIDLLWISPMAPYDKVPHAGGKTHNYYTKSFGDDSRFATRLCTYCLSSEEKSVIEEFSQKGIRLNLIVHPKSFFGKIFWKIMNIETIINPFNRYGGLTRNQTSIRTINEIKKLKKSGYDPDIIFLHWTQVVLLIDKIKKIYPKAKYVCMEVDVTFQGYERRLIECKKNLFKKFYWFCRYSTMKKKEIVSIEKSDLVIVNNVKDERLVKNSGIHNRIFVWSPFFQKFLVNVPIIKKSERENNIVFYGAMARYENWKSAIWFIDNVMPLLKQLHIKLYIVGSNPPKQLLKYNSDDIVVTGFVENIAPIFQKSLCSVAPLIYGAGIKVKVLESMCSGIPVLTNQVGIEGIPAVNGVHYLHCDTPIDFAKSINSIVAGEINIEEIGKKARTFVQEHFDYSKDSTLLRDFLFSLKD